MFVFIKLDYVISIPKKKTIVSKTKWFNQNKITRITIWYRDESTVVFVYIQHISVACNYASEIIDRLFPARGCVTVWLWIQQSSSFIISNVPFQSNWNLSFSLSLCFYAILQDNRHSLLWKWTKNAVILLFNLSMCYLQIDKVIGVFLGNQHGHLLINK